MKKLFVLGMIVAMLGFSACRTPEPGPGGSRPEAVQPDSSASSDAQPLSAEELLMRDYVHVYEKYCSGAAFSGDKEPGNDLLESYLFGWLKENNLLDRYAVYEGSQIDYYTLPFQDAQQFYGLFFDAASTDAASSDLSHDGQFSGSSDGMELELKNFEKLENGNYQLTIRRLANGREWYPAAYEFAPADIPAASGALTDEILSRGDTAYRFVSVRNLPMDEAQASTGEMIAISTPGQLAELAELVNSGDWAYQNNVYRLTADLDMSGVELEPVGSYVPQDPRDPAPRGFSSTFDGRGHIIKNLVIKDHQGETGLFARLGKNGFIADLRLEDCDLSSAPPDDPEAFWPAGGIVGIMEGGAINRCSVSGQVSGYSSVGGLAGYVGALSDASRSTPSIQACRADVTVNGNHAVGGLIGTAAAGWFNECTALGQVNVVEVKGRTANEIGGFIGVNQSATIDRGIVSVEVKTTVPAESVGSFAGCNSGNLVGCFYNTSVSSGWHTIGVPYTASKYTVNLIGLSQNEMKDMGVL